MKISRLFFLGSGEVGHQIILNLASLLSPEDAKRFGYVILDGDVTAFRNPSFRNLGWSEGIYKVAISGYELASRFGLKLVHSRVIPLQTPPGTVMVVPRFASIPALKYCLGETDLLVESTDNLALQATLGIHAHTGMAFDRLAYSIEYGEFHAQPAEVDMPDCPEQLGMAAQICGRRTAEILVEFIKNPDLDIKSLKIVDFVS